jgi:hypothetical protein
LKNWLEKTSYIKKKKQLSDFSDETSILKQYEDIEISEEEMD